MSLLTTGPNNTLGQSPQIPFPILVEKDTTARSDIYSCSFLLVWLIGTIFLGKDFAYIHVGPLYITEMALGVLVMNNINRLRMSDVFIMFAVFAYVVAGTIRHESFTFAGKDIIWLPYVMFLRFFPRNFPHKYIQIVIACCFIKVVCCFATPVVELFHAQKYRDGVTILFVFLFMFLKTRGNLGIPVILGFLVLSVCIAFKTLMLVMLIAPFVMKVKIPWERYITPIKFFSALVVIVFMIKFDVSRTILAGSVDLLSSIAPLFGVDVGGIDNGTSDWRADIWYRAINNIFRDNEVLFGQLPGFNYMDDKYLGRKLNLFGGDTLGVVRTGHNILVQMMMKAGFVGVIIYVWYFFKNLPDRGRMACFFIVAVFGLALTADVLEVPSRGPLFYCLLIMLSRLRSEELSSDVNYQQA